MNITESRKREILEHIAAARVRVAGAVVVSPLNGHRAIDTDELLTLSNFWQWQDNDRNCTAPIVLTAAGRRVIKELKNG